MLHCSGKKKIVYLSEIGITLLSYGYAEGTATFHWEMDITEAFNFKQLTVKLHTISYKTPQKLLRSSIFFFETTSTFSDPSNSNLSNRECVNTTFPLSIAKEHAGAHMFA